LGYASRKGYTLLDRRLSMPRAWVEEEAYAERRRRCGVPTALPFKTKPTLVWEMIQAVHQVHLTGELKTSLSTAPAATALATLVRLSGMRWPIETCCEDGKQYVGMGDYEVRSWRGRHHHMTLCILAHFFLVRVGLRLKNMPRG
jgi:SRSO17 transposase